MNNLRSNNDKRVLPDRTAQVRGHPGGGPAPASCIWRFSPELLHQSSMQVVKSVRASRVVLSRAPFRRPGLIAAQEKGSSGTQGFVPRKERRRRRPNLRKKNGT